VIAGNHDLTFDEVFKKRIKKDVWFFVNKGYLFMKFFRLGDDWDTKKMKALLTNCTYLEDSSCTAFGYNIYGSPWSPRFYD